MSGAVDASSHASHAGSVWPILLYLVAFIGIIRVVKHLRNKFRRHASHSSRGEYQQVPQVQENELYLFPFGRQHKTLQVSDISWSNQISFTLNGNPIEITNPSPTQLLASYLRDTLGLKGTKLGCEEGGCGACSVVLQDASGKVMAANSCLRLLCMNDGMSITTVEGIGSIEGGLSEEQQRLVASNGTQCGFCTPGWVTATRALRTQAALDGRELHRKDIEKIFDGNICRCTGYRPIMQALHSFCADDSSYTGNHVQKVKIPCHTPKEQCCTKSVEFGDIEEQVGAEVMCPSTAGNRSNRLIVAPASVCVNPSQRSRRGANNTEAKPLLFHDAQGNTRYYRPVSLLQLKAVLSAETKRTGGGENIMLVTGHTSIGVSKYLNDSEPFYTADKYQVSVDVGTIPALTATTFNAVTRELTVGAAVSLESFISLLQANGNGNSAETNKKSVFSVVSEHLGLVANTQVRSVGSWAGNLLLFLRHPQFPSDVSLALAMAQATLVVTDNEETEREISMATFLTIDYQSFIQKNTVIIAVRIKDSAPDSHFNNKAVCFAGKTALREHNAHAMINFASYFTLTHDNLITANTIVVGGAVTRTTLCSRTISTLQNQVLTQQTLNQAMQALAMDLTANGLAKAAEKASLAPSFLLSSAQGYLYRSLLNCYEKLNSTAPLPSYLRSAIGPWVKPPSSGVEVFPLPRDGQAPVGAPVKKLEAPAQTTGEAMYPSDIALPSHGLHAALVFATIANVTLVSIDITAAMAVRNVSTVLTAKDIPSGGVNQLANGSVFLVPIGEIIPYVGAIIAIVVAESEVAANEAVSLVSIQYNNSAPSSCVVTNINQAKAANSKFPLPEALSLVTTGDADAAIGNAPFVRSGTFAAGGQYHFYMEAQAAVATPNDGDRVDVICGSQFPSLYSSTVAGLLNVPTAKLTVECPRTGGAFGGKITGGVGAAAAAALTCKLLKRPVRVFNTRTADMNMLGGREEWQGRYRVGYDQTGRVLGLQYEFDVDAGCALTDTAGSLFMGMHWADNAYYFPNYTANAALYQTNTPARTSMRAPGVLQSCLATEMVMEHVASSLNLPLSVVQEANFIQPGQNTITGQPIPSPSSLSTVWNMAKERSLFDQRLAACQQFNATNIWTKRGVAMAPVKYGIGWSGYNAGCVLMVSSTDGMVTVKHSGCEIGQGINTKVAQAVAMALSIPLSMVIVAWTSTGNVANGGCTGGSSTSEVTVQAAVNAAAVLNTRLDPYRASTSYNNNGKISKASAMNEKQWTKLISSVPTDVSLTAEGWYSPSSNPNGQEWQYFVYAACAVEVELDVLTGRLHVLRTEMVYDCGASLNPAVDCGQIEGALVLTLGYFFSERVRYDDRSGMLATPGTWEYKPPLAADIPSSLRLTLIADSFNSTGILGSKAVGEPPMIVANAAYLALKMAIGAARADAGVVGHFDLAVPATIEQRQAACLVHAGRFILPKC